MGRLKKEFLELPTAKMRRKAYARIVRMALCYKTDISKSCANLMDGVIKAALEELERSHDETASRVAKSHRLKIGVKEGSFVSSGRWKNWWDGAKPDPKSLEVLEYLLPQTRYWFSPHPGATDLENFSYQDTTRLKKSAHALHPIHNFLCAVDLWASKKECSLQAISHLLAIQKTWRPRQRIDGNIKSNWFIFPIPLKSIPPDIVIKHIDFLSPSSIMNSMMFTGEFLNIDETEYFTRWTFDLVSAALATQALLNSFAFESEENGESAIDLAGSSADAMGFLYQVFISKYELHKDIKKDITGSIMETRYGEKPKYDLPSTDNFKKIIHKSLLLFESELLRHGINIKEISALNPWLYFGKRQFEE
ncbi:MAG: hypothetical protein ACKVN9_07085 [Methylophilaceae bacterium]